MNMPKFVAIGSIAAILGASSLAAAASAPEDKKKPKISVKGSPSAGFSPLKVVMSAELKGGDSDHPEFYCPTIEWVWGDDTRAESTADCDPYEPGKSEIKRRYTVTRVFNTYGEYKVEFRVKQKDKVVGYGTTTIRVQPGVRDGGGQ